MNILGASSLALGALLLVQTGRLHFTEGALDRARDAQYVDAKAKPKVLWKDRAGELSKALDEKAKALVDFEFAVADATDTETERRGEVIRRVAVSNKADKAEIARLKSERAKLLQEIDNAARASYAKPCLDADVVRRLAALR